MLIKHFLIHCGLVTPYGDKFWVNVGSGNVLLSNDTKPSPEQMLTFHKICYVAYIWE